MFGGGGGGGGGTSDGNGGFYYAGGGGGGTSYSDGFVVLDDALDIDSRPGIFITYTTSVAANLL